MTVGCAWPSDGELMRRVQGDDPEAFGVLYDRLAPRAFSIAFRILDADHDRAQDAVQEGFVSLWRSRATYRPDLGDVHCWAFGIIRHRANDAYRRNSKHARRRAGSERIAERVAAPDDVHGEVVAASDARELQTLLGAIPLAQREAIVLAYYGGLSQTEIARQLTVPLGTVKSRMRLGLAGMRERLEFSAGTSPLASD